MTTYIQYACVYTYFAASGVRETTILQTRWKEQCYLSVDRLAKQ